LINEQDNYGKHDVLEWLPAQNAWINCAD